MAFWGTNLNSGTKDPKRNFRFKIVFNGLAADNSGIIWFAKTVSKPEVQVSETEHKYLGHTFYYPGVVTWQPVTLTLVDPVTEGAVAQMNALLEAAGYKVPGSTTVTETISKAKTTTSIGNIEIIQMGADGEIELEKWILRNPFITGLKFGSLDYSNEDLTELEMTLRYDWAECVIANAEGVGKARLDSIPEAVRAGDGRQFFNTNTPKPAGEGG